LQSENLRVSLLTFEPRFRESWSADEIAGARATLADMGIGWHYLPYHKTPSLPATLYDIAAGTRAIARLMRREGVNILHARNHVPALMCAIAKRRFGVQLVFDIRGFMPEEYTDAGVWPANGYLYRGLKRVERYLLKSADAFVVLTEKARDIMFSESRGDVAGGSTDRRGRPIEVIPCCVDFERFENVATIAKESLRDELKLANRRVIVYVGSFGGWYMTDEMTEFLSVAQQQDPSTFSMILTQSPKQMVAERLAALGIAEKDFIVTQVAPGEVPRYLKAADIAISFIKPCYSKQSSSPTKMAEYLASGLPIVCNAGVGDLDKLIVDNRAGALLREFNRQAYLHALEEIEALRAETNLAERLRGVARREFDLVGVGRTRYRRLYERLLKSRLM
jgi:glycosyltransferase involved in cell wall biosynthesis